MEKFIKDNKGISLVEILVVIGILAILTVTSVSALSQLSRGEIKKAVKTVQSSLVQNRIDSMAKTGDWKWCIEHDGSNYNIVIYYKGLSDTAFSAVDTIELSDQVTSITFNDVPLESITFKKNTGAVNEVNTITCTSGVGTIAITCSGNTRTLKLYYLTGKVE